MEDPIYPNILTRVASVEQSYFPPRRPSSFFLRVPSANTSSELEKEFRPKRPDGLRRATSITPTATVTVSTDKVPQSQDGFLDVPFRSPSFAFYDEAYLSDDTASDCDEEVTSLDLSASGFDCIPVSLFQESDCFLHIQTLDLSQNPICSSQDLYMIDTVILPHLMTLILRRCGMSRVDPLVKYLKAPELRELDISNHEFTGFVPQFQQFFPKLIHVNASRGQFEFIDEAAWRGLKHLDLTDNLIQDQEGKLRDMAIGLGVEVLV